MMRGSILVEVEKEEEYILGRDLAALLKAAGMEARVNNLIIINNNKSSDKKVCTESVKYFLQFGL